MPPSPADYAARIKGILQSVQLQPDEAKAPILHYRRTVTDIRGSLGYVERLVAEKERYQVVVDRHMGRLRGMALVTLVETFERFLKEVAAECVDRLADLVVDDRFNEFPIQGATLRRTSGQAAPGKRFASRRSGSTARKSTTGSGSCSATPFWPGIFTSFRETTSSHSIKRGATNW